MADAVIIDDGGSTRIKQLKGSGGATGDMDQLMEPGNSDNARGSFTDLRIQYLDKDGTPGTAITDSLTATTGLTTVTISSENEQTLTATVAGGGLTLKLTANSAGVEPLVHGKQNGIQRRYVVANAGAIQKVEIKKGTTTTLLYDTQATPPRPEAAAVYTMIVLK
jgi:hypothetical protein